MKVILLGMLIVNSILDIHKREISLILTAAAGLTGLVCSWWKIVHGQQDLSCLLGMLPGMILMGMALLSGESIGMGDGLAVLSMGTMVSFDRMIKILLLASGSCSVFGICMLGVQKMRSGRKEKGAGNLPFVPFLLLGYLLLRGR